MIFLTVGAQLPFDRLSRAVDAWAGAHPAVEIVAQIGTTGWRPTHLRWVASLSPTDFRSTVERCTAIVAHAGMGSIITALQYSKPILVMPRRGDLRETRNDHQIATAKRFRDLGHVEVAMDESELPEKLDRIGSSSARTRIGSTASPELIEAIRQFIGGAS